MTLKDIINKIIEIADAYPNVNYTHVGNVYDINHNQDVEFSAFVLTQQQHQILQQEQKVKYQFNLFYVDRLTSDESNRLDVQTSGFQCINYIVNALEEYGILTDNYVIHTFNERFNEYCSGVYATVYISLPVDDCGKYFEPKVYNLLK